MCICSLVNILSDFASNGLQSIWKKLINLNMQLLCVLSDDSLFT